MKALYSAPLSAGEPQLASVRVKFRSNGYERLGCELVASSGNAAADTKACDALPLIPTKGAVESRAPVWIVPPFDGEYRGPIATTNPASWLRYSDVPKIVYESSQGGIAVVRVDINAAGGVAKCAIYVPSNSRLFDAIVQRNFCPRVSFKAATLDGNPINATMLIALRYFSPN